MAVLGGRGWRASLPALRSEHEVDDGCRAVAEAETEDEDMMDRSELARLRIWRTLDGRDFSLIDLCELADPDGDLGGITAHTVAERLMAALAPKADIEERLRGTVCFGSTNAEWPNVLLNEAADEIERLRWRLRKVVTLLDGFGGPDREISGGSAIRQVAEGDSDGWRGGR